MKNTSKLFAGFLIGMIAIFAVAARKSTSIGGRMSRHTISCDTLTVDTTATFTTAATFPGTATFTGATVFSDLTATSFSATSATITTAIISDCTATSLASTSATITNAIITNATATTLNATAGTVTTLGSTTANITTGNITSAVITAGTVATSFTNSGINVFPFDSVSLTSPAVTFVATGRSRINITADAALTGIIINDGTLGQEIVVYGTSDSNTVRFDDGTSYTLGGNITLGVDDALGLICTNANGNTWRRNFSADN